MDEPQFLLEQLSERQIYHQTYKVFRKESKVFFLLAAFIYIMSLMLLSLINLGFQNVDLHLWLGISHLFSMIGYAAMSRATGEIYLGQQPKFGKCLVEGLKVFLSLFFAWLIVGVLLIFLVKGFLAVSQVLLMWPAFFFYTFLICVFIALPCALLIFTSMMTPVATIEKKGTCRPFNVLKRSYELVINKYIFILKTAVALFIVQLILDGVIQTILSARFGLQGDLSAMFSANFRRYYTSPSVIGLIVSKVTILLFAPLLSIMQTLVYLNIRIENEDLDVEVLKNQMDETANLIEDLRSLSGYFSMSQDDIEKSDPAAATKK